jgi:hypothetical protein
MKHAHKHASIIIFGTLWWTLAFPWYIDVAVLATAVACIPFRRQWWPGVLFLLVLIGGLSLLPRPHGFQPWRFYERPDAYAPNIDVTGDVSCGSLAYRSVKAYAVAQPRRIRFVTDSLGWPNESDYHGQEWVLIGDSFIAGVGASYEDQLGAVLLAEHGIDTYTIARHGAPHDYFRRVGKFIEQYPDIKIAAFIFEGNDFKIPHRDVRAEMHPNAYDSWRASMLPFAYSERVFNLTRAVEAIAVGRQDPVIVRDGVAYLHAYKEVAETRKATLLLDVPDTAALLRTREVFFIPTKWTVDYGGTGVALEACCKIFPQTVDLTPALRATDEAFWRDDTHWGPAGVRAAALVVAPRLVQDRSMSAGGDQSDFDGPAEAAERETNDYNGQ